MGQIEIRQQLLIRILSLLLLFGIASRAHADDKSRLTVALILPLTGDWAFLGNGIKDGALLAKADLERDNFPVDLLFEDNHGDLTASVTAAKRLLADDRVDAFISIISGVSKVLKPMADKAKIINIGICSDTEVADGRYSFVNYLTAEQGASKYVEYFLSEHGPGKSVGIYAMNEAGFQRIVEEIAIHAMGKIQIRFTERFDRGVSDFKPIILRNQSKSPDAILILGLSPEIELIARQARSLGIAAPLTSIESFGLSNDKTAFEGAWFVDSAVPDFAFRDRFQRTYGREVTPGVGHSYDSVLLLARAFGHKLSNGPGDRPAAVKSFREISELTGVTGKIHVRSDGIIWSDATVKKIVGGQPLLATPCYGVIDSKTTIHSLTLACGNPARDVLSGLYGPEWDLGNRKQLRVSSSGLNSSLNSATLIRADGSFEILYSDSPRQQNKSGDLKTGPRKE